MIRQKYNLGPEIASPNTEVSFFYVWRVRIVVIIMNSFLILSGLLSIMKETQL